LNLPRTRDKTLRESIICPRVCKIAQAITKMFNNEKNAVYSVWAKKNKPTNNLKCGPEEEIRFVGELKSTSKMEISIAFIPHSSNS
jgi:hypothetical protein